MRSTFKKLLLMCAFACIIGTALFTTKVSADSTTKTLSTDDNWFGAEISETGEVDYYKVTIPSDGWLTVSIQGRTMGCGQAVVMSADMAEEKYSVHYSDASEDSPKTASCVKILDAGTYIIKVTGHYHMWYAGTYKIKASFKAAGNNDGHANRSFENAMSLAEGQNIKGLFSIDNYIDYYKITATSKQVIVFNTIAYLDDLYITVYDGNWVELESYDMGSGSETSAYAESQEATLPSAGTYYVKVNGKYSSTTGRYNLKYLKKVLVSKIAVSGKSVMTKGTSTNLKATVYPSNATNKTIKWSTGNYSIADVDATTGKVTAYSPGKVIIQATSQDGSEVYKSFTIIVKPEKMSKPSVNSYNYSANKFTVSFDQQSSVKGYQIQYAKNKKMKNAKTTSIKNNNSYYPSKTIKGSRHTKYYVRVRSYIKVGKKVYYGNWSAKTTYRTK